jgi:hypothetical protein
MSSSRDTPFSFSPEVLDIFGSPNALNGAVRIAHPQLFDHSVKRRLLIFDDHRMSAVAGASACALAQLSLPTSSSASSPAGVFAAASVGATASCLSPASA